MSQHLTDHALAVLNILLGQTVAQTPEVVARSLRLTTVQVGQAVEHLRSAGCDIELHPQRGLLLNRTGLGCWADFIESRHVAGFGRRLIVYARTASTQDIAKRLVLESSEPTQHDGCVVVADHQTTGRGRLGRQWFDQPGTQLLLTAISVGHDNTDRLMLAACYALSQTIEQCTGLQPRIRWPNDLMLDRRKLAGILVETVGGAAMIGLGLNVTLDPALLPPPLDQIATSLAAHHRYVDRLLLLDTLLEHLQQAVHHLPDEQLHNAWRDRCDMLQQRITVRQGERVLTGRVLDIDPLHGLLLEVEHGPVVTLPAATTRLVLDSAL